MVMMMMMITMMMIKPEVRHPPGWGSLPSLNGIPSEDYNHIMLSNCHLFNADKIFGFNSKFDAVCDKNEA